MYQPSFARILPLSSELANSTRSSSNTSDFPKLMDWRIDFSMSVLFLDNSYTRNETTRTFIIGVDLKDPNNVQCLLLCDDLPQVNNLELDLHENQFTWKDVKYMSFASRLSTLFIATHNNRVYGVPLKLDPIYNSEFGKIIYPVVGKLLLHDQVGAIHQHAIFEMSDLIDLEIQSMAANSYSLFIISNGKLYSCGYNFKGGAARGQKNVQHVEFGACEVKVKGGKQSKQPYFVKVVGYESNVAALTSSGKIYMCGERALSIMSLDAYRNLFTFKELEVSHTFIDVNFHVNGIVALTNDHLGVLIQRCSLKLYGKVSGQPCANTEEVHIEKVRDLAPKKKLIKFFYHSLSAILIYNDNTVSISHNDETSTFQFNSPICYPNNGSVYELNCTWFDSPTNHNIYFFWKFNKENYLTMERYSKKLQSHFENQLLTDVTIHCLMN